MQSLDERAAYALADMVYIVGLIAALFGDRWRLKRLRKLTNAAAAKVRPTRQSYGACARKRSFRHAGSDRPPDESPYQWSAACVQLDDQK